MKKNRILWIIIAILLFATTGLSIYSIQTKSETKKTMAAYIIFIKEKTVNQEELNIYAKEAPAGLTGHNIITRAAYGKNQVIEGADVEGVAILEFPSFEEAKAWYENPIYQKAKEHRLKGGIYRAIIVDGLNK